MHLKNLVLHIIMVICYTPHSTGGAQSESSDPADFVWGARGLDSIISGLLESMSDRGPPPAKKDKVDALPIVEATQEIINESKSCVVCIYMYV